VPSRIQGFLTSRAGLALLALALCFCLPQALRAQSEPAPAPVVPAAAVAAPAVPHAQDVSDAPLAESWSIMGPDLLGMLTDSRMLLLGLRSPEAKSCVQEDLGNLLIRCSGGGVGTRLADIHMSGVAQRKTPVADFEWMQTTLRQTYERMAAQNALVASRVVAAAARARDFAQALRLLEEMPSDLVPTMLPDFASWPTHCAAGVNTAIAAKDLPAARMWADELASALFGLADLHRWVAFLTTNSLDSLDFQSRCKGLYTACNNYFADGYDTRKALSNFPAGRVLMRGVHNFQEVEHQAEWLFRVPAEYVRTAVGGVAEPIRDGVDAVPAAVFMPPHLRATFLELREHLGDANRRLWDQAAGMPYERSYLANMLFRAKVAGTVDDLGTVLDRYEQASPAGEMASIMDVLFYRGDASGGAAWDDRFNAQLMKIAGSLKGPDEEVLLAAQRLTRGFFGGWENYEPADSLTQAIQTRKLDCLNATDMIAALYRNAGRGRLYGVRWSAGVVGHSVAAIEVKRREGVRHVLVDGLTDPQIVSEDWPNAYYREHEWPAGYTGVAGDVYSVELMARGLDNYIWCEGYMVRGPDAGMLARAAVPYLPTHNETQTAKVYTGPYPSDYKVEPRANCVAPFQSPNMGPRG
jgi:hypothetical protein